MEMYVALEAAIKVMVVMGGNMVATVGGGSGGGGVWWEWCYGGGSESLFLCLSCFVWFIDREKC